MTQPTKLYVLRVRTESVPQGLVASGNAVVLNPSAPPVVQVFIKDGIDPERYVRDFTVSQRGKIVNLTILPPTVVAHAGIVRCLAGPDQSDPPATCDPEAFATADYAEDLRVDLRDYAFLQNFLTRD